MCTAWCSEIGSLTSLDACNSGAFSDVREPFSLHQAVHVLTKNLHFAGRAIAHSLLLQAPLSQSLSLSLSLSSLSLSLSVSLSLSFSLFSLSLSLSLSLTHTHTHTHARARTHAYSSTIRSQITSLYNDVYSHLVKSYSGSQQANVLLFLDLCLMPGRCHAWPGESLLDCSSVCCVLLAPVSQLVGSAPKSDLAIQV